MKKQCRLLLYILPLFFFSCVGTKKNYNPNKKYSKQVLQQDFTLLRNILEKKHPSLYWYTSKDSMDNNFAKYYNAIADSMTEQQFGWKILAPLTSTIHCGHTSFSMSKSYNKWVKNKRLGSFPLFFKVWNDTMAITGNLNRKDSFLTRGTLVTSINGQSNSALIKTMFNYMVEDGYANNVNYLRLSSNFPYYHRNIFGLSKQYQITYLDDNGNEKSTTIDLFNPPKDSTKKIKFPPLEKKSKKEIRKLQLQNIRSLAVDTANNTAIITINSFNAGRLRKFFRQTFKYIKKTRINNVVIDIRSNGGGKINLSNLLTKYVSRVPFKVADTSYAIAKSLRPYSKYIKGKFINNLSMFFVTKKRSDGLYHFRIWEKKVYHPKTKNHFDGDVYVLINGQTFSAAALFSNAVKGQPRITLLGEETGGGWHGNSGVLIPDITLPNTHLKVRLPLFRLIQYNHVPKNGMGVPPDIYVGTNYEALLKSYDKKMQVVMEIIKAKNAIH